MSLSRAANSALRNVRLPQVLCMLGIIGAGLSGHHADAQRFASPNQLGRDGNDIVEVGYLSFSTDVEARIFATDQMAANRLNRTNDADKVEVFVVLAQYWKKAVLANAGLTGSTELRSTLDAMVGKYEMLTLHEGQFGDATYYNKVLLMVTEADVRPIGEDCLVHIVPMALYQGRATPSGDMTRCVGARQ